MKIKLEVCTGWANGDHVRYEDLPEWWGDLSEEAKQSYIEEAAREFLHECCQACGELVEDDEES